MIEQKKGWRLVVCKGLGTPIHVIGAAEQVLGVLDGKWCPRSETKSKMTVIYVTTTYATGEFRYIIYRRAMTRAVFNMVAPGWKDRTGWSLFGTVMGFEERASGRQIAPSSRRNDFVMQYGKSVHS
jgi:hypothetical protein